MEKIDEYYPIDDKLSKSPMREIGYIIRIKENLDLAKKGNRIAESKLCNRIGILRRTIEFENLNPDLQNVIKEAVSWLRSIGRKIDFSHQDPRYWITTRDGNPRF